MKINTQLTNPAWLLDLKDIPAKEFLLPFKKYYSLLKNAHKTKIKFLEDELEKQYQRMDELGQKARKELKPVLLKITDELLSELKPDKPLEDYIKSYSLREHPLGIYMAIKTLLERFINDSKLTKYSKFARQVYNDHYFDDVEFENNYPAYKEFNQFLEEFRKQSEIQPWGIYNDMEEFAKTEDLGDEKYAEIYKSTVIERLRLFLYFLLEDTHPTLQVEYSADTGIKGLYSLQSNPPAVQYNGKNKKDSNWIHTKNKTQTFAILKLAAQRYQRAVNTNTFRGKIKLSFKDIMYFIENPENCDWKPEHEAISLSPRKRLRTFRSNICSKVPFSDDELYIEGEKENCFLVFYTVD